MITALDSSVIVAALAGWHERHEEARRAIAALFGGEAPPVISTHALVEAFSVFTRLPAGYRISPVDAERLLRGAFHRRARVVSERSAAAWSLLACAAESGVAGGAVYDLRIARAARSADATRLLTLNPGDFERLSVDGIEIVAP